MKTDLVLDQQLLSIYRQKHVCISGLVGLQNGEARV
jgi:hypothetical protein